MKYILGDFNENGELRSYRAKVELFLAQFPNGFLVERGHKEGREGNISSQTRGALQIVPLDYKLDKSPFSNPELSSRVFYLDKLRDSSGKFLNVLSHPRVSIGRTDNNDVCLNLETISGFQAYYVPNAGTDRKQHALVDCASNTSIVYVYEPKHEGSNVTYMRRQLPKHEKVRLVDGCIILFGGRDRETKELGFAFEFLTSAAFHKFLNRFSFI